MARAKREAIRGLGAEPPEGYRGKVPGRVVRGFGPETGEVFTYGANLLLYSNYGQACNN